MKPKMDLERIKRAVRPFTSARPRWRFLDGNVEWELAKRRAAEIIEADDPKNKNILIATMTGGNWECSSFDSLLGVALTLKGANVYFLLCDGKLPACQECDFQWLKPHELMRAGPKNLCGSCYKPARSMFEKLGLPVLKLSDYALSEQAAMEAPAGIIDEHARSGLLRYFAVGDATGEEFETEILERYRQAAKLTFSSVTNLLLAEKIEAVVAHHGIYVPQGLVVAAAQNLGVDVVCWGLGYKENTIIFSSGDSYHRTLPLEEAMPENNADIMQSVQHVQRYLKDRESGINDWISFYKDTKISSPKNMPFDASDTFGTNNNSEGLTFGLFTNVVWDAQLHFRKAAYSNMLDWLFDTIDLFANTRHRLVIRVHPAEVRGSVPSRQRVLAEISKVYAELPTNIRLVDADDALTSYQVAERIDVALIYGTKMAIELAASGIPVIVAGDAWARGKGFTWDVGSRDEYWKLISEMRAPLTMTGDQINAALNFAKYIFLERMVPIELLIPQRHFTKFSINPGSLDEVRNCSALSKVCDAILTGSDFRFAEIYG